MIRNLEKWVFMKGWKYEKKQEKEITLETIEQRKKKRKKKAKKMLMVVWIWKEKEKEKDRDQRKGNCVEWIFGNAPLG